MEARPSMRNALAGTVMRKGSGRLPGTWADALPAAAPSCPDDSVRDIDRCSPAPMGPVGCPRPSENRAARLASAAAMAACPAACTVIHQLMLHARQNFALTEQELIDAKMPSKKHAMDAKLVCSQAG